MLLKCTMNVLKRTLPKVYLWQKRYCSERPTLVGRDFIDPGDFTSKELKTFLWSAMDLKHKNGDENKRILQSVCNCSATIIMRKPHINSQVSISNALNRLGCSTNIVIDECWEKSPCSITDLGRSLSKITNIIIAVDCQHDSVNALRDGAKIPVINFSSTSFQLIECLANLLTVQEFYGFLRGLKICWIGPLNAALITYVALSYKLKMNIQFVTTCGEEGMVESQDLLNTVMKCAIKGGAQVCQFLEVADAIYRAHAIVTTMHSFPELQITEELVTDAAVNWILLHHLPRSSTEVSADVFTSEYSLVWDAFENQMWILMAVATHLLREYQPSSDMPDFDGINVPPEEFYQP